VNDSDWIIVGRFGRPHGVRGLITVISFTEPRDNILRYAPWYVHSHDSWQVVKLLRVDITNKSILAQIENYNAREQAALLTNVEIAIKQEQLPELENGEYYWHQLVGMKVVNSQGIDLGAVKEIMPTGANDVLVVEGEKRYLIPYLLKQIILRVDGQQRLITVDWDKDF
jgi:16S rRNA processing protein RimM